jgi:hypothetical protein
MSIVETTSRMLSTPSRFPIDIRFSVPFLPHPFFVTLIAGPERRGSQRLIQERERHPLTSWGNLATFVVFSTLCGTAFFFASLVASAL